jgi:hypothetical protein
VTRENYNNNAIGTAAAVVKTSRDDHSRRSDLAETAYAAKITTTERPVSIVRFCFSLVCQIKRKRITLKLRKRIICHFLTVSAAVKKIQKFLEFENDRQVM